MNGLTLLKEFIIYVNYRKQSSPSLRELLPVEFFRLYAVSTRHPENLEKQAALALVKKGVYDLHWGSRQVRLIVPSEVPKIERNALWLLYSSRLENVQYGASHYRWRRTDLSTVMNELFKFYQVEGIAMPYTVEDYKRDRQEEFLASLTSEELETMFLEKLLKRLPPEKLLKGLPPEELLKRLRPEERLKGLTREEIEAYLKKLSASN